MDLNRVDHKSIVEKTGWEYYDSRDKWYLYTCPFCLDTETSSKKKKCYIFKDTGNFKCFRCGKDSGTLEIQKIFLNEKWAGVSIPNRESAKKMSKHKMKIIPDDTWHKWHEDLFENQDGLDYLASRGISAGTISDFKIGYEILGGYGYIVYPYFTLGKCTGAKKRKIESKTKNDRFISESGCTATLYNLDRIKPGKPVIITESEIDCLSLYEVGFNNVVAVPGCNTWKDSYADDLSLSRVWYLCFDPDQPGQESSMNLVERYGNRCRNIILDPDKDINELLLGGITYSEVMDIINDQKANTLTSSNAFVHDGSDVMAVFNEIGEEDKSQSTYFGPLDRVLGGWRPHEMTILSADSGMGKSTVAFLMALEQAKNGHPAAIISLEEPCQSMITKQLTHFIGKPYHTCTKSEVESLRPIAVKASMVPMYHHYNPGYADVDELLSDLIYEIEAKGVRIAVIDHLDFLEMKAVGAEAGDLKYTSQIMKKLSNFVKNYPIHIILIAHTRKKARTRDGQEVNRYSMDDIRGNSDIIKLANNVMFFYRSGQSGKVELDIRKCRSPAGRQGSLQLYFNLERMKLGDTL